MLNQKVFLQGVNYLKANYINWQFDINNDLMLKVWYKKFSNLDEKMFMSIIEKYTEINKYPPNSPCELLDILKNEITNQKMDSNEAWLKAIELLHDYGFRYNRDEAYKHIKNNEALTKTVEQFERELINLSSDDTFTQQRFKQAYEINLSRVVYKEKCKALGFNNVLMIDKSIDRIENKPKEFSEETKRILEEAKGLFE